MQLTDLLWLAGYLEGEGCFSIYLRKTTGKWGTPTISVSTTDEDVAARVKLLFNAVQIYTYQRKNYKKVFALHCCGENGINLMCELLPYMGQRRQAKIKDVLTKAALRPGQAFGTKCGAAKLSKNAVLDIKETCKTMYFGLQTELAKKYNVSASCIWYIANNKSWREKV